MDKLLETESSKKVTATEIYKIANYISISKQLANKKFLIILLTYTIVSKSMKYLKNKSNKRYIRLFWKKVYNYTERH